MADKNAHDWRIDFEYGECDGYVCQVCLMHRHNPSDGRTRYYTRRGDAIRMGGWYDVPPCVPYPVLGLFARFNFRSAWPAWVAPRDGVPA